MKRLFLGAMVLILTLSAPAFAQKTTGWAIGGAFAFNWAGADPYGTGAALCLKFPTFPVMFGISANFNEPVMIGVTADWWLFQTHLVGPLNLYIGPGLFLHFVAVANGAVDFGLRIPIGFQIFIIPAFEIFLEPAVAIGILPQLPTFSLQAAVGFRFWF